ncbi:major capsid protein [Bradyrhizobium sp. 192]|uniref:major capsid protein n=1 Tax=Bradyrhizobium sp. 192 TaxID=2782660 RepID=UPI001FFFDF4D|nr:major capsid protein [Bradyrhizobium sp. 192]UPJ55408.1 major capsid protein [Bradyrhizobium sp. 192]
MLTMDVFKQDAFSSTTLTAVVDKLGYTPSLLGTIPGLFNPVPIRTTAVFIEERTNGPALIQTSPRGAPPKQRGGEKSKVRAFETVRLAEGSRITASELQGIRAFGSETELKQLQTEVARRQGLIRGDFELTWEFHRLGALQGKVLDADGTSVIYDWAAEFNQAIPAELDFDLDNANPATGAVRKKCNTVKRSMLAALKGLGGNGVSIGALCGDAFWDDLTSHPEVEKTFLATQQAQDLRAGFGTAWSIFKYGDITWINYRGSDDGVVGINTDKAKFFPIGANVFQVAMSPGESFEFVNTPGQAVYSGIVTDKDRNSWADVELFSYPLFVCTMPSALYQGKRT